MNHAEKMNALKNLKDGERYTFAYLVSLGFEPSRNQESGVYDGPCYGLHMNYWGRADFTPTPMGEDTQLIYWAFAEDKATEPAGPNSKNYPAPRPR